MSQKPSSDYVKNQSPPTTHYTEPYKPLGAGKASSLFANNPYIKKGTGNQNSETIIDYSTGDRVKHIKFGQGTITDIIKDKNDYIVTVNFDSAGTRKMKASFAKLSKL